jgi:hypothetical protein
MEKTLPTLDQISVASPCRASWSEMTGDDRARFCSQCKLHVYDLSAMNRDEAEKAVQEREGRTCVRFFRRQDGTILTRDCPVGLRAVRQRFTRAIAALAGMLVALIGGTLFGSRANRWKPAGFRSPSETFAHWVDPREEELVLFMGDIVCPLPAGTAPPVLQGDLVSEPAESPLPEPTAEQLEAIQQRLAR